MPRKDAAAVWLGRRGGEANTKAQDAARARNGLLGGRPTCYRLVRGALQRKQGDRWLTLTDPLDAAAKAFLRRHR